MDQAEEAYAHSYADQSPDPAQLEYQTHHTTASLPPQPTPRIPHPVSHLPPNHTMSALKPGPSLTSSTPLPTQQLQQQQSQQAVQQRAPGQTPGLRYPSSRKTIYDRNLSRSKNAELSRAAFAFLFVEMIGYAQRRVKGITDLEKRWVFGACSLLLDSSGGQVGGRIGLEDRGIGNQ